VAHPEVALRVAGPDDLDQIVAVCSEALGWVDPEFDQKLFEWKHIDNAFGPSMLLIAEDETGVLAVRPFMRWRFTSDGGEVKTARAVDTATRPDAQGRGLFRALTELGIKKLAAEQTSFIFNTPNSSSRPGYLRMGWDDEGRVEFALRIRSVLTIAKVARSRVAATKRSISTPELGVGVGEYLESLGEVPAPDTSDWHTDHTLETLSWRYEAGPIEYRALPMSESAAAIVRLRQRGSARELLVAEQIGHVERRLQRRTLRRAMRSVRADHLVAAPGTAGTISTSRIGPLFTMRSVASDHPAASEVAWAPGDVELF